MAENTLKENEKILDDFSNILMERFHKRNMDRTDCAILDYELKRAKKVILDNMKQSKIEDFQIKHFKGMEVDPADRDVGIFSANYSLWGIDTENRQISFNLDEEGFTELVFIIKDKYLWKVDK